MFANKARNNNAAHHPKAQPHLLTQSDIESQRNLIRTFNHADEDQCVRDLIEQSALSEQQRESISLRAETLVSRCRENIAGRSLLDAFLQEFGLSNQEGIALMCMAEALLRIPDPATADKLIHEKILSGNWQAHLGQSDSVFVNSSTWGLLLTGALVSLDEEITANPVSWLKNLVNRSSEPVIRTAVMQAMRLMGGQYVLGRDIDEALKRGTKDNPAGTRFSFDMLGEGARTFDTAEKYFEAYLNAIETIGANANKAGSQKSIDPSPNQNHPQFNNGISVKLSALHPHYDFAHHDSVMQMLLPQLTRLALAAKQYQLGFTIDAEESERLDISLDIFEALARNDQLLDWDGLGIVVQAYQKRAPYVIDWLATLATQTNRVFMVRLVKGAYWDREIKFAQEHGLDDYPVYTRKISTDLSYQICVSRLFNAGECLYPQFATHNAYTTALILETAQGRPFEFQRLHGMGGLLYQQLLSAGENSTNDQSVNANNIPPLRVYAPVGAHQNLLPYLVRRLLENGANSSFVNQFLDKDVPVHKLIEDPIDKLSTYSNSNIEQDGQGQVKSKSSSLRHPLIPKPVDIYRASGLDGGARTNSMGLDLNNPVKVDALYTAMQYAKDQSRLAGPIINGEVQSEGKLLEVFNPANKKTAVGSGYQSLPEHIDSAFTAASHAQDAWDKRGGESRAVILDSMADLLEKNINDLLWLISNEAGRTIGDALDELREAVDFCRYYGLKAREHFAQPLELPGPTGETNELSLHGRGVFLCISPWNFPMAIFIGQISAALAAGNTVIAKPAEQTPLVAARIIKLFHQAGVPNAVLHMITGAGAEVGPLLVEHPLLAGVAFTGSTATAKQINRQLAARDGAILPLIAETGGQNAMIVDSSALPEQVVDDVISSAFLSAGQRCSALRVLYLQEDIADTTIELIKGAMEALTLGNPTKLSTDVGPVIDSAALYRLQQHIDAVSSGKLNSNKNNIKLKAKLIAQHKQQPRLNGTFFGPCIVELDSIEQLDDEIFGPVLHIIRYSAKDLATVIQDINNSRYGLTLGVHTRIENVAEHIFANCRVGNTYVNRNMVGAVVGSQPFGGEGLSGTGPKAGGPRYLFRFATEKTRTVNTVATGGNAALFGL